VARFRDLPRREQELFWLSQAEQSMRELRENFGTRTQSYEFLTEPLGEVTRERIRVTAIASGVVKEAPRTRGRNR
jgi:hypothetical protein